MSTILERYIPWPVLRQRLEPLQNSDFPKYWRLRKLLNQRIKSGKVRVLGIGEEQLINLRDLRRYAW